MSEVVFLLPEIFLTVTILGMVLAEIGYHGEKIRLVSLTALLGLLAAFVEMLLVTSLGPQKILNGAFSIDGISFFFKLFFILLGVLVVAISIYSKEVAVNKKSEYYAFIVGCALSMCVLSSATDIVLVLLSFLMLNILGYFLSGYDKKRPISAEASVKYMIFSVVSGAMLLYGVAILFSFTHTLNMYEMHHVLLDTPLPPQAGLVVFVLFFLALCFHFGAFPMHLWVPDVLEGAPTPTSVFLALGIPAAGFVVALRFFVVIFGNPSLAPADWEVLGLSEWPQIVALASGVTMVVGSLMAFRQTGAKRMMAFLTIANTGFLLMSLLVLDQSGVSALLYNLLVGLFSLVGVFAAFSFLFDHLKSDRLKDFRGMIRRSAPECICLLLFLACFVGFPPFPGFIGKFVLISAIVRDEWYVLGTLAVGSSVVGIATFARLSFSLVGDFRKNLDGQVSAFRGQRVFLFSLLIPVALLVVFAEPILNWSSQSLNLILW